MWLRKFTKFCLYFFDMSSNFLNWGLQIYHGGGCRFRFWISIISWWVRSSVMKTITNYKWKLYTWLDYKANAIILPAILCLNKLTIYEMICRYLNLKEYKISFKINIVNKRNWWRNRRCMLNTLWIFLKFEALLLTLNFTINYSIFIRFALFKASLRFSNF